MTRATIHPLADITSLIQILTYQRPAGTKTERDFVRAFVKPTGARPDARGNYFLTIGNEAPRVLWSCHTDTVHRAEGRQKPRIRGGMIRAPKDSSCLGADDGAGVWLMLEMIRAKVPGLYIFHRAEEVGGLGSAHVAEQTPDALAGIQIAIAFDRRGTQDVITHQGWSRCCSDDFAKSLAAQLPGYRPDDSGVFTDTANYTRLIPECTNISVGYQAEHTANESLDSRHLLALRDAMLSLDPSKLVVARDPADIEEADIDWRGGWSSFYDDADWRGIDKVINKGGAMLRNADSNRETRDMAEMIADNPEIVADLLEQCGVDSVSLAEHIYHAGGLLASRMLADDDDSRFNR